MKKPIPPNEIEHYTHDRTAWLAFQLPKIGLALIALFSLAGMFVAISAKSGPIPLLCMICFLGSVALLCWLANKKRTFRCRRCVCTMEHLEVDWNVQAYKALGGKLSGCFFAGADGRLYSESRGMRGEGGGAKTARVDLMKQRWYVCHRCKRQFLGEQFLSVCIFEAPGGLYQTVNNIKNDPEAGREMEERRKHKDASNNCFQRTR